MLAYAFVSQCKVKTIWTYFKLSLIHGFCVQNVNAATKFLDFKI